MTPVQELAAEASLLEPDELEELIDVLSERLEEFEPAQEWIDEALRRSERLRTGESKGVPWSEVRARMFARVDGLQD